MALNADFYLQPSIICLLDVPEGGKQTPVLPASSSKFDEACRHITATERKNIARITLQLECESTPKNGSWSSMWHVHAISSVLKRPVFSVYPKVNERTRSVFHKNVFPRLEMLSQKNDVVPVVVLWTHTRNRVCSRLWSPNHFVPCYAINSDSQTESIQSLILASTLAKPTYSMASTSKDLIISTSTVLAPSPSTNSSCNDDLDNKSVERVQEYFQIQSTDSVSLSSSTCVSEVQLQNSTKSTLTCIAPQSAVSSSLSTSVCSVSVPCCAQPNSTICTTELVHVLTTHNQKKDRINSAAGSTLPLSQYFPKKVKADTKVFSMHPESHVSACVSTAPLSSSESSISKSTPSFVAIHSPISSDIIRETTAKSALPKNYPAACDMPTTTGKHTEQWPACTESSITLPSLVSVTSSNSAMTIKAKCTESTISTAKLADILTTPKRKKRKESLSCQLLSKFFCKGPKVPKSPFKCLDSCSNTKSIIQTSTVPLKPDCIPLLSQRSPNLHFIEPLSDDSNKSRVHEASLSSVSRPSTNHQAPCTEISEFTAGVSSQTRDIQSFSLAWVNTESVMDVNASSRSACISPLPSTQDLKLISVCPSDILLNSATLPAYDPKMPLAQTKSPAPASPETALLYQVSKASTDTSKSCTNPAKLTESPNSNTITPSMVFSIFSFTGHHKSKHKKPIQSQKITDFMNNPALIASAHNYDSDDSLDEFSYLHDDEQESGNSFSSSRSSISDESDMEIQLYPEPCSSLPFPKVSAGWYAKQYSLSIHNAVREEHRHASIMHLDERNNIQFINRSQVNGTLENNISSLIVKIEQLSNGPTRSHLQAVVAVGKFIALNGPLVSTQDAGQFYMKEKNLSEKKASMEVYEILCKHLNLAQVYMFHTAYLIENSINLPAIFSFISNTVNDNAECLVKQEIDEHIKQFFPKALHYMDSHRDRRVVKALLAELTNISFASKVQGIQSRKGTASASKSFKSELLHYQHIRITSQVVRSDLTNVQQYKLTERIISRRKLKEIKTIANGRGRKLKCEKFPELATALMYAFGEIDAHDGGGLEAHPRLTNGTLYRSSGGAMIMKTAREILLSLAPEGFTISLSACYNYTENFRAGSAEAKRHHAGKGVNAQLSLRKPPRTGVEQVVINLHWSTANVNLLLDSSPSSVLISKDAKAIIPADIAPVQRPGHSWKSRMEFPRPFVGSVSYKRSYANDIPIFVHNDFSHYIIGKVEHPNI